MDTNPLHASRTSVSVAKQRANQTCSYTSGFPLPRCSGHANVPISAAVKWGGLCSREALWLADNQRFSHYIAMKEESGVFPVHEGYSSFQSDRLRNLSQSKLSLTFARPSTVTSRDTPNQTLWKADCGRVAAEGSSSFCVLRVFSSFSLEMVPHFFTFLQERKQILCFGLRFAFQLSKAVSRPFTRKYRKGFLQTIFCSVN